jgi:hypothetical protein
MNHADRLCRDPAMRWVVGCGHRLRRHDERQPSAPGNEGRGTPWYKQSGVFQGRAAVNHQL